MNNLAPFANGPGLDGCCSPNYDSTVDQLIGNAYQVVKFVALRMPFIKSLSDNIDDLIALAGSLEGLNDLAAKLPELMSLQAELQKLIVLYNNLSKLVLVADNMTQILTVHDNLPQIQTIVDNLTQIQTVVTNIANIVTVGNNIAAVNNVHNNMSAVLNVNTNMAAVNNVSTNMTDVRAVATNMPQVQAVAANMVEIQAVYAKLADLELIADQLDVILAKFTELSGPDGSDMVGFQRADNPTGSVIILRDFLSKQTSIHPSEKGGIGDGIADDTEAIRQCILSGRPINTGLDGEIWRLGSTLTATLISDLRLNGFGNFIFDAPAVQQYGVLLNLNGKAVGSTGYQFFDFQDKVYNGIAFVNDTDTLSYFDTDGVLHVENVFRSGSLFTGDAGITVSGKVDGVFDHVKLRRISVAPSAAIAGVAGACGILVKALSVNRSPRNIGFGILDLNSVYKRDAPDNVDQDGARLYAAEDTVGDLRPYNTKYTIDHLIARNCVGRSLKIQADWSTVSKATITRETETGVYTGVQGSAEIDSQTGGLIIGDVTANYTGGAPHTLILFSGTVTPNKLTPYGKASNIQVSTADSVTLDSVFRIGSRGDATKITFSANQVEVRGNLTVAAQIQPPSGLNTTIYGSFRDFFTAPSEALIRTTVGNSTMYLNVSGCPNIGPSEKPMLIRGTTNHNVYLSAQDSALGWTTYPRNASGSTGPVTRQAPITGRDALYGQLKDFFSRQLAVGETWALPKIASNGNTCKGSICVARGRTDSVDFIADSNGTLKNSPDTVGTSWTFGTTTDPGSGTFRIWADADHVYLYNGHTTALWFSVELQS